MSGILFGDQTIEELAHRAFLEELLTELCRRQAGGPERLHAAREPAV